MLKKILDNFEPINSCEILFKAQIEYFSKIPVS